VLFIVAPLAIVVFYAFTDAAFHFSVNNFVNMFNDATAQVFSLSLAFAFCATCISLVIAYPLAYFISRASKKRQNTLVMLFMLPMWMNFLLRTYALSFLLEDTGFLNNILGFFGIDGVTLINTPGAVIFGMVYNFLPYMIMPLYSIMTKIDGRTIEAAADLGANTLQTHRSIILPMSLPGIISGITMVFVPSVSTFVISGLLGGSENYLIGDVITAQMLGSAYNLNYGSATSLLLMIVVLVTMIIFNGLDSEDTEGMLA
jgi:spermidine/putrescine transport system permease protein